MLIELQGTLRGCEGLQSDHLLQRTGYMVTQPMSREPGWSWASSFIASVQKARVWEGLTPLSRGRLGRFFCQVSPGPFPWTAALGMGHDASNIPSA